MKACSMGHDWLREEGLPLISIYCDAHGAIIVSALSLPAKRQYRALDA